MSEQFGPIQDLLDRVRARWRRVVILGVLARAALAVTALVVLGLLLARAMSSAPVALASLGVGVLLAALAAVVWAVWPARRVPSDRRIARYIEECDRSLDERLVSAVDLVSTPDAASRPALAAAMVTDAARAASQVDPRTVIPTALMTRRSRQAGGAVALLLVALVTGRDTGRQSWDALSLLLWPSHITLEVTPGNARVQSGNAFTVQARLVGNRAPVVARLLQAAPGSDEWQAVDMNTDGRGAFTLTLDALSHSFRYRVLAGPASSDTFDVAVITPPRVARIDVEYAYPPALGLAPRLEEDGGDIYGPAGTNVVVIVHTDAPVANGQLVLSAEQSLELKPTAANTLRGALEIAGNGSYRVALADGDGMKSRGDTEYFIRILDDRPPDVHVVRPAGDRRVTRLDEIEIAAEAQDDFGVAAMDLVYAVRGGAERVVPMPVPPHATTVSGRHVLYLEELDIAPGDFISYYVRARDLPRGKRASESRSDIFFLEVKPFEEEFTLAQTQAAMGGGSGNPQLDDLVAAQKEIVVATWKLDRRSRDAQGAKSESDIKAVAKSEAELKQRVEQTSSSFRESTMRDPRRTRTPGRPGAPQPPQPAPAPGTPRVGQAMAEEDAMTTASKAMGLAVTSLESLRTSDAMPHEMEALNALLRAQADVKKRQIQQQRSGQGNAQNRSTEDLSALFDKELAKNQQTNYENKTTAEQTEDKNAPAVDRIKELARRQDELVRKQQEFARNQSGMSDEERKRQLDSLSREQNDLRDRAEEVAKQLQQQQSGQQQQGGQQQAQQGDQGQRGQQGQPSGQPGQSAGQQGQPGQSGQRRPGQSQNARQGTQGAEGNSSQQMRDISEQMRSAATDLRRQDAGQASARGAQALEQLRQLEQALQASTPEGRRRALGDLQLEARQLADAQRQIASEANRAQNGQQQGGQAGADALRRLAGEQDRLAERLQRVQEGLRQSAGQPQPSSQNAQGRAQAAGANMQQAAADAARDIQNQRLGERMQQSADAMRRASSEPSSASSRAQGQANGQQGAGTPTARQGAANQAGAQQELARALDKLADRLNLADTPQDDESKRLNEQVTRARDLRDRMDDLTKQLQELDRQASGQNLTGSPQASAQGQAPSQRDGRPGQGQGSSSGDPQSIEQLRQQIAQQMREVRELMNQSDTKQNTRNEGGPGSTFEGQGMVTSAPGTQGFKQDFARWQELTRQVTLALDAIESTAAKRLQEKTSKDRLASGADERAPAGYEQQVDSYFKALATRKRP